jgi:hypothetical protein
VSLGRPTAFTPEIASDILDAIAKGKSLVAICSAEDMPCRDTVYQWKKDNKDFSDRYARAVEARAEFLFEEILTIADDDKGDYGFKEVKDGDGEGAKPCILPDNIQRAKLRVDSRKWFLAKVAPKVYGEFTRTELTGKDGGPLAISIADQIRQAHEQA